MIASPSNSKAPFRTLKRQKIHQIRHLPALVPSKAHILTSKNHSIFWPPHISFLIHQFALPESLPSPPVLRGTFVVSSGSELVVSAHLLVCTFSNAARQLSSIPYHMFLGFGYGYQWYQWLLLLLLLLRERCER